jgi:Ni/Fe-hydrogenase subunit HybB-like protein
VKFLRFVIASIRLVSRGRPVYYAWVAFLLALMAAGAAAYVRQLTQGLIVTGLRDPMSWGFYIGNFTFLVGVAAAAIMLVIPAYVYHWKPIREVAILGELLAVSAIVMCILFVAVDIGRPERIWHMIPRVGSLNFPSSLLAWDVLVLNLYFILNFVIVTYLLYKAFVGEAYSKNFVYPLVLFSIPMAVSIHTVTAFLYNGLAARPFWNASILAPRFLTSAFCSGPAILIIVFQIIRKFTRLEIRDEAIWKVAELMAYAMAIDLFLLLSEIFKEFYSGTHHLVFTQYLFTGLHGHYTMLPYAWTSVTFSVTAFLLFLVPATRKNFVTLNIGCVMIYISMFLAKGIVLVVPGQTPDPLGEIYEYMPTNTELLVSAGIWATGFLLYTWMVKVAAPIMLGEFRQRAGSGAPSAAIPDDPATSSA